MAVILSGGVILEQKYNSSGSSSTIKWQGVCPKCSTLTGTTTSDMSSDPGSSTSRSIICSRYGCGYKWDVKFRGSRK